ncbi:MAG: putative glycolipid-binding domain-containing protein [Pseudonocardia sp.]|nr:putative glycolipid-binding domain-containing protein [Pseudonocardia sp.]
MSTPTGEKVPGATTRRTPHTTKMVAWAGVDCLRVEAARVLLGERGMRATGSIVSCRHRLNLHRSAAKHDLSMVFVSLPDLEVSRVPQGYRTISLGEPAVVGISSDSLETELTVDPDGLVLEYPGLARRS